LVSHHPKTPITLSDLPGNHHQLQGPLRLIAVQQLRQLGQHDIYLASRVLTCRNRYAVTALPPRPPNLLCRTRSTNEILQTCELGGPRRRYLDSVIVREGADYDFSAVTEIVTISYIKTVTSCRRSTKRMDQGTFFDHSGKRRSQDIQGVSR